MAWYLQIGDATPQSFTDLNCVGLKRELRSQTPGTFTFRLALQTIETNPLAAVDTPARVLWIDGDATVPYFAGRITRVPLAGSTKAEDQNYVISDPWSDFERITFQQQWNRISVSEDGSPSTVAEYSACCLLGVDLNGNPVTSDQQIIAAVNWAIARGANCQPGAVLVDEDTPVGSPIPVDEVTDLPVAEIIKKMMRFTPDGVCWFDYSASPPKFNVTRQSQCATVTQPFVDEGDAVDITPRNDLLRTQVLLRYEQPNVSDGETITAVYIDAAGEPTPGTGQIDGLAFGALVSTVRLAGSDATFQKQPITVTPIPQSADDANAVPFLQLNHLWLRQFSPDRLQVTSLSVVVDNPQNADDGTPVTDFTPADYPNQILTGTVSKWMQSAYPTLKVARVTVTAQVSYQYPETEDDESTLAMLIFGPDDSNLINYDNDVQVLSGVKGSNAVQKVYAVMSDYTEAEQPPTGLAAVLYSALSTLQYEGSWNVIRQEPAASNTMGIVLNLTGGRTEWASMNALVQEIVDDLDNGITTYKFGPAGHLTIQDLMEQLRTTRGRTMSSKIKERQTGQPDADVVNGSGHTAETNNSTPPMPFPGYPFLDFIDEQDDDEGNGVTWDVLFGYGQSTFSGADEIDHSGPIEKLEISVGNDGSDWTGPEYDSSDLNNALSIISGDEDYTTDCIRIGATDGDEGGSIRLLPGDPSIYLSTNLDPADDGDGDAFIHIDLGNQIIANQDEDGSYIHLDLSGDPIININNANTGNYSSLDENSLTLYDETYIGCTTTIQAYDAEIDASPAGGATVALDALNQVISITDPSGDPQTAMGPGSLKFWNPGVGGNDISVQLIDPSIYLYGPEFNQIILQCNQVGPYISLAGDLGYTAYSVWMDLNYTGPGPATWQTQEFFVPDGSGAPVPMKVCYFGTVPQSL